MTDQTNVQLIQQIYDSFARGDINGVMSLLDPNAELHFEAPAEIPWAGTWKGPEGWGRFFQALAESTEGIAVSMKLVAAQGSEVVFAGRYRATVKRTGKRIDSPLVHLWTVANGKVLRCCEYTDTAAELAACTAA